MEQHELILLITFLRHWPLVGVFGPVCHRAQMWSRYYDKSQEECWSAATLQHLTPLDQSPVTSQALKRS